MVAIDLLGLEFEVVESSSIFIGTDKGGWVYSGQRPRHEVECPTFYVLKNPLSRTQVATILSGPKPDNNPDGLMEGIDGSALKELLSHANSKLQKIDNTIWDNGFEWEVRCPSESEWRIA
ncbi:MAG: hypothetical protein CXT70_02185, partial [Methanobacteriota archaeon]